MSKGVGARQISDALGGAAAWCSTMDKAPWNLRIACPALAFAEIRRDMAHYFQPVSVAPSDGERVLGAWRDLVRNWMTSARAGGFSVPAKMEAVVSRSLPKSKAPGEKGRLVIAHNTGPTAVLQRYVCKGAELLCDMVLNQGVGSGVDTAVMSWCQVRHQLGRVFSEACQGTLQGGEGFTFECGKFDYEVFFMNVPRRQVAAALRYFVQRGTPLWGENPVVRIVRKQTRPTMKALGIRAGHRGLRWHSRCGVGAIQRRRTFTTDTVSVSASDFHQGLKVDVLTPLAYAGGIFVQQVGLAIGSPWGGSGCRIWGQACQATWQGARNYMRRRFCAEWVAPRWVDDRWTLTWAPDRRTLHIAAAAETIQFQPGPGQFRLCMLLMAMKRWAPDNSDSKLTVRAMCLLAKFLQEGISQTAEDPATFVGADVVVYKKTAGAWHLTEGSGEDAQGLTVATRLQTKSADLREARTVCGGQVGHHRVERPRLPHRRVDPRSAEECILLLVTWVTLLIDMLIVPQGVAPSLPPRCNDTPDLTVACTDASGRWELWASEPVRGLVQEMRRCEWRPRWLHEAMAKVAAGARIRGDTRREQLLHWVRRWLRWYEV